MSAISTTGGQVPVRVFGGPTALIEYGGLRFLTDPTFDAPGTYDSGLTKTVPASAAPALHGPGAREDLEPIVGEVVVFVLTGDGLPTVYVSGGNAQLGLVQEIADRFGPVYTAVLFAGAVRTALLDRQLLTLDSTQAAEAARILGARRVVPVHFDSWAHFTEGRDQLVDAFTTAGLMDRVQLT
ncbi:MBL fold metallo-hydrolase [Streptomyces sp. GD-15H]|uniref:MBL fold metallo-hydrolase n=1 Tax=Streptomyces sp. GD-15H TaxID=3129112 RepID=UPI00324D6919